MDIKYKIIEVCSGDQAIVVRYYSDAVSEASLALQIDGAGNILRCRTDVAINLPLPTPIGVDLDAFIMRSCPTHFLRVREVLASQPADFSSVAVGVEVTKTITEPSATEQARADAKAARNAAVEALTVTVGGKVLDGDEQSQTRMARAILGMQAASVSTINWTLANNVSTPVTIAELTEALILAGQAQAALWPISV